MTNEKIIAKINEQSNANNNVHFNTSNKEASSSRKYTVKANEEVIHTSDTLDGINYIVYTYMKTSHYKGNICVYDENDNVVGKFMIR